MMFIILIGIAFILFGAVFLNGIGSDTPSNLKNAIIENDIIKYDVVYDILDK